MPTACIALSCLLGQSRGHKRMISIAAANYGHLLYLLYSRVSFIGGKQALTS